MWAYLNRSSKQDQQKDLQPSNQEKIDPDSPENKTPNKTDNQTITNPFLQLTQIQVRSKGKNPSIHNKEITIAQNEMKNEVITKEEKKKNKNFYFVNYVSSIEKSHSSSAIEGKCLKRLGSRKENGDYKEPFGLKCFSTTEDLPQIFTSTENHKNNEDSEGNLISKNNSNIIRQQKSGVWNHKGRFL